MPELDALQNHAIKVFNRGAVLLWLSPEGGIGFPPGVYLWVLGESGKLEFGFNPGFLLAEAGLDFGDFAGVICAFHDYCADDEAREFLENPRVDFEEH